ncbi:hypothetical protein EGW08_002428, partial [Elysia chlorotica]
MQHVDNNHIVRLGGVTSKMSGEERLTAELQKAEAEISQVENRLSENGLHYSAERAAIREEHRGSGGLRPATSNAVQLRARLAAQTALDEDIEEDEEERDGSEYSEDEELPEHEAPEIYPHGESDVGVMDTAEKKARRGDIHVTIVAEGDPEHDQSGHRRVDPNSTDAENEDDECVDDDNEDDEEMELADPPMSRRAKGDGSWGRRKSISFSYKPVIASPSVSNGLLNVLSIDDCKFHMRYSPHKILEEHEITENLMLPFSLLQFDNDNDTNNNNDNNNETSQHQHQNETNSKMAMRMSRSSSPENIYACDDHCENGTKGHGAASPNTSIRSSTARRATAANVRRFKAMNDPEDIAF